MLKMESLKECNQLMWFKQLGKFHYFVASYECVVCANKKIIHKTKNINKGRSSRIHVYH